MRHRHGSKGDPVEQSPRCERLPPPAGKGTARGIGRRVACENPPSARSPLKGLTAAKAGAKRNGSDQSSASESQGRIYMVPEDELSQEIFSEITVHEQEIQALRNEFVLLKQRRGRLREAWARGGWVESNEMVRQEDQKVEFSCRLSDHSSISIGEERDLPSPRPVQPADTAWPDDAASDGGDDICTLKRNIGILRETDRQRQIEVEQQAGRWRMEADESIRIAEEMR